MQPTSSSAHTPGIVPASGNGSTGHSGGRNHHRNAYAMTLRTNIERLIPLEMMQARRSALDRALTTLEHDTATVRFAGANNSANGTVTARSVANTETVSGGSYAGTTIPRASAVQTARRSKSTPHDIDFLCAVASRDLIEQTVADLRKPGVWNEHLLDVLLALKRKLPDLLGASSLRVVASNLIPSHMALLTQSQRADLPRASEEGAAPRGPAPAIHQPTNHRTNPQAINPSSHLSFVHDAQHYHIVNTKEAFFRAIISMREEIDPIAVSQQNIDALIEDTADFLEDHWREYYRVVWTKMAQSAAT